jgi:hypothetical protein
VRLILFCRKFLLLGDEAATRGDMGGVEVVGIGEDDELRANGLIIVMSLLAPAKWDFGEGIPEPMEHTRGWGTGGGSKPPPNHH